MVFRDIYVKTEPIEQLKLSPNPQTLKSKYKKGKFA
jgi:hypothetical protein